MRFVVSRVGKAWLIRTTKGEEVAIAESVSMGPAVFVGDIAMGEIVSVWGAQIAPGAHSLPKAIQGLGLGRAFQQPRGRQMHLRAGDWFDNETNQSVAEAQYLVLHPHVSFYTPKDSDDASRNRVLRGGARLLTGELAELAV